MFLGWIILALFLFGLGRLTYAAGTFATGGFVTATDEEADAGYFAVGSDAMIVVKQGAGLQGWLKAHSGQRIRLVLEADPAEGQ